MGFLMEIWVCRLGRKEARLTPMLMALSNRKAELLSAEMKEQIRGARFSLES